MVLDQMDSPSLSAGIDASSGTDGGEILSKEKALDLILEKMAEAASTQRDKGTRFEMLALDYFRKEPTYCNLFTKVETYSEWARNHQHLSPRPSLKDIGIDLVATNAQPGASIKKYTGGG